MTVSTGKHVHRITEIDIDRQVATCQGCGPESPIVFRKSGRQTPGFYVCRTGRNARSNGPRSPDQRRVYKYKARFGITVEQYDHLHGQQNGVCAICTRPCPRGQRLAVDHDHTTGEIRGLLCGPCNRAIGLFGDDLDRLRAAITYLS